jgi:sec-independent protein translocase protein TatA
MFGLGPLELIVCFFIVLLLFGVKRLPELGSGLGEGISNFRKSFRDGQAIDVTPPKEGASKSETDSNSSSTTSNDTPS